jgi:hypothetical protein
MTARFAFLAVVLFLAACVSPEQRAVARQAADRDQCINYGFQEGTDAYAECRMTIDQQRRARKAAITGAILSRPNPTITCNTMGNAYGGTTTCQ